MGHTGAGSEPGHYGVGRSAFRQPRAVELSVEQRLDVHLNGAAARQSHGKGVEVGVAKAVPLRQS